MTHLIAIDQGTTSTRAIVFDAGLAPVAIAQQELRLAQDSGQGIINLVTNVSHESSSVLELPPVLGKLLVLVVFSHQLSVAWIRERKAIVLFS